MAILEVADETAGMGFGVGTPRKLVAAEFVVVDFSG